MPQTELSNIAVFIDYENFGQHDTFDVRKLIDKLKERGRLIIKRAYADWGRFSGAKRAMLENSVDLIEMPTRTKGKNAADIRLVVDALETAITKDYIDTIVVVSGDSDYTPLISKLREYNKYVIVVGGRKQTSRLLVGYCDELIFYSNLVGEKSSVEAANIQTAYDLLARAVTSLEDQGLEVRSSQLKPYMKQLDATFDESNYGFSQFKRFLQQAAQEKLVDLEDVDHGNFLVRLLVESNAPASEEQALAAKPAPKPKAPVRSPKETHDPKLLNLIYWAFKINEVDPKEGIMLGSLAQTIKTFLEPDFDISDYNYSKGRGFKGVVEDLQNFGYATVTHNQEKNQHIVVLERPFIEYGQSTKPPENYHFLRLESSCARMGLTANFQDINLFLKEAIRYQVSTAAEGRRTTLQELFDEVRTLLQDQNKHIPYKRVMNTIIRSGSVCDMNARPIETLSDIRPVGPFPPEKQVIQRCAVLLKNSLMQTREAA